MNPLQFDSFRRSLRPIALAACCAFAMVPPAGAAPRNLLAHQSWTLLTPSAGDASLTIVAAPGLPDNSTAELRVQVSKAVDPYYLIQAASSLDAIPVGDRVRFQFWARADSAHSMRAVVETVGSPWTAVCQTMIALTPQWTSYTIDAAVDRDYGQPLSAKLQVGGSTGLVEFAGVTVEDTGPDRGLAEAREAVQPAAVRQRIRRYRMGDMIVRVVDAHGRAVPRARVSIRERRSAFLFGCNFFGLNPADNSPAQTAYRDQFAALFNYATLPFYWGAFEPEQGKPQFDRLDPMVDWCLAHGIEPKAHPLVWHEVYPSWAPADPDSVIPLLHRRVVEIVMRERNRIHYYDVVNEAADGAGFSPANGESRWLARDGAPKVVETVLGWARAACNAGDGAHTSDTFIYNDYETGQPNVDLLTAMARDGHLPDAIGIQSHMHGGVWPMEQVWQVCQRFAAFHRPIHFTETTVLSGPRRTFDFNGPPATDWDTTPDDEQAQADYVVRFYSVLFSHPSVQAITWWDFSDQNSWLGAPSGLIRKDMSPKPAYIRLLQLIRHDWWTNADGRTDPSGAYRTRAFYGDYDITVDDGRGRRTTRAIAFRTGSQIVAVTVAN